MNQRTNPDDMSLEEMFDPANSERINTSFYDNPAAVLRGVAVAALKKGREEAEYGRLQQEADAATAKNWNKLWNSSKLLSDNKAFVREFVADRLVKDQKFAQMQDIEAGIAQLGEEAEEALKEKTKRERDPDYQDSLIMRGSLDETVEPDDGDEPDYRLSDMIRQRRGNRRGQAS